MERLMKNNFKRKKNSSKYKTKLTHEQMVSRFYTCGTKKRSHEAGGFLSFGYWNNGVKDYYTAAKRLLEYVLDNSGIKKPKFILNVACGYGTETIRIYKRFKPKKIYAIDITESHINFAKQIAEESGYNIDFQVRNACKTGFPDSYFSHIIGIEGPAHFNTRELFLKEAYRVLQPGGYIILTDIIALNKNFKSNPIKLIAGRFCSKRWHMPPENWTDADEYRHLLEQIGFTVEKLEIIGDRVYPGFSASNLRFGAIINAIKTRGFFVGLGLTIISWLLGFLYRRKMLDYIFLRAKK
jgi:ubiquinone/menaquinone biosynthesis C-methylase UbiE